MTGRPKGVLGIKTAEGAIVPVLDFRTQRWNQTVFTTVRDRQNKAVFDFYYQDDEYTGWLYLDSVPLNHIPPARAGEPELSVTMQVDGQGNLSVQIHDPKFPKPSRFVLRAEILRDMGGDPEEVGAVSVGSTSRPSVRNTAKQRTSGPPVNYSPPVSVQEKKKKSKTGWLVLVVLAMSLVVSVFVFDLNPVTFLRGSEERTRESGEADRSVKTMLIETSPVENAAEMVRKPAVQESGSKETAASGFSAEPRQDTESTHGQEEHQRPSVTPGGDNRAYLITWGDTLWRITERFYGDREIYPTLADANRIPDPDVIIAGETLLLPPLLEERRRSKSEEDR